MKLTRICLILISLTSTMIVHKANAQRSRLPAVDSLLYHEIFRADSAAFAALNTHNASRLMTFFTKDVEFYNDGGGLTTYKQTGANFEAMFKGTPAIRRELVRGSLEVYPLKDYGAIAIGAHRFCHPEKGREECGTFNFTTVWQKKDGAWKMARVISYGH